jgi:hypothetical protein
MPIIRMLFEVPTHFLGMISFAVLVSVAFAFLSKQSTPERLKYMAWAIGAFLIVAIVIGWLMYPFSQ